MKKPSPDRSKQALDVTLDASVENAPRSRPAVSASLGLEATLLDKPAYVSKPDPRIGTLFREKYRIDGILGKGGFGCVYRATHIGLNTQVAIKFLLASWAKNPVFRARFEREARVLGRLRHPGIVAVHDFGEESAGGDLYLVMELVPGRQLTEEILSTGMPTARVLHIADQLLEVLTEAHAGGVVHRDLKPAQDIPEKKRTPVVPHGLGWAGLSLC